MLKFFKFPFALDGDRTDVPNAAQTDGTVSYDIGYGEQYQLPSSDPDALKIERDKMNDLFFSITNALKELQSYGVPDFITSDLNGGTAFSYSENAIVRYSGSVYISLADTNTALPIDGSKWSKFGGPVGRVIIADGAVEMINADEIIEINKTTPANTAVTSPPAPTPFKVYTLKDGGGNAGDFPITLIPYSGTIDGRDSFELNSNYQSISFYSNGTDLRIIG